ncbi:MAG: AAC(3) family N-acetyltransferase [Actinomycetia bacterium]|nr:AAC(3) family N-acetyltransferase [Actinomycetes bacterium]MCP4224452.1 AAC(3) family N-acetyltransferase [Actinomycetes bacterium]MCP5032232.1 AAC(3) family N-acetyltransferase [Actinomycetes bacterium]
MSGAEAAGSEEAVISASMGQPSTVATLIGDLHNLGLGVGDLVIIHSSLSRLGWVVGGAQAVVEALMAVVGSDGTLIMPTHSAHLSEPGRWTNPPVPTPWISTIRAAMPAYDPRLTPTRAMGAVVECFRSLDGAVRGSHPRLSFTGYGPLAEQIVAPHELDAGLGPESPLGRLYESGAKVALLGVGHGNNTSLHLAEYLTCWPDKRDQLEGSPILVDGVRQWVTYHELAVDDSDFELLGEAFAATGAETQSQVGSGTGRLFDQRQAVDFATTWIQRVRR